jgi:hypothetical protein
MLNPFIIDQIKKREQDERRRGERQPVIELPLPMPVAPRPSADDDDCERGVVVIDLI